MHNLLSCTDAGDLEREDGDGGFDAQELHQPVLMLGLDLARRSGGGEGEGRFVFIVVVCIRLLVAMAADGRGALILNSAAHKVRLVGSCGRGAEACIVFKAVIYDRNRFVRYLLKKGDRVHLSYRLSVPATIVATSGPSCRTT